MDVSYTVKVGRRKMTRRRLEEAEREGERWRGFVLFVLTLSRLLSR